MMIRPDPLLDWDDRPRGYGPARYPWGRWLWLAATASGFLAVLGYVLGHDDPIPGLSERGWLTLALAALLLVLLSAHRARGGRRLVRALAEYAVVALLAGLLASAAGAGAQHQPARQPARAGQHQPTHRPAHADTAEQDPGMRGWFAAWWQWAKQEAHRHTTPPSPPSTTRPRRR